jgi:hypothetical protein
LSLLVSTTPPLAAGLPSFCLLAEVDAALGPPSPAWLVARRSDLRSHHAPCASEAFIDQVLPWEVSFRLPLELFEYPRALFDIEASDRVAIALPAPGLRMGAAELLAGKPKPRIRPLLRRSVVGLATGLALAAGSDSFVGLASAASAPTHTAKHRAAAYAQPAATGSQASASSRSATTTLTASTTTVTTTTVTRAPSGVLAKSTTTQTATSDSRPLTGCVLMTTIVGNIKASETGRHAPRHKTETACGVPHKKKKTKKSRKHAPRKPKTSTLPLIAGAALTSRPLSLRLESHNNIHGNLKRRSPSHTAAPAMPIPNSPWTAGVGIDPFTAAEIKRFSTVSASLDQPPAFLIPIYKALFAYNHALWYVDAVLWRAAVISDRGLDGHLARVGYALPLDAPYMAQLGRTDDGVDIEDAPDGAAVYSITPGVVTAVASDPGGFGPDYPVILVTAGPLAGQYVYYGHVGHYTGHGRERQRANGQEQTRTVAAGWPRPVRIHERRGRHLHPR